MVGFVCFGKGRREVGLGSDNYWLGWALWHWKPQYLIFCSYFFGIKVWDVFDLGENVYSNTQCSDLLLSNGEFSYDKIFYLGLLNKFTKLS